MLEIVSRQKGAIIWLPRFLQTLQNKLINRDTSKWWTEKIFKLTFSQSTLNIKVDLLDPINHHYSDYEISQINGLNLQFGKLNRYCSKPRKLNHNFYMLPTKMHTWYIRTIVQRLFKKTQGWLYVFKWPLPQHDTQHNKPLVNQGLAKLVSCEAKKAWH